MPTLSRRDQEQLEKAQDLLEAAPTADLGFVKSLMFGRLRLDQIMPYPQQDAEEIRRTDEMIARVDEFLRREIDPDRIDAEERIPQSVIDGLGQLGVMGMTVPREYGGGGFTHTSYCRVIEHVSRWCASTAVLIGAHQSIGLKALLLMGTEAQKREFLPDLASGRKLAAFCLSEPEVGSDAANVQTRAEPSPDGSHWVLNGEKRYATNAALAGFMTVMARTPVIDNRQPKQKITAFIVTPDVPGFVVVSPNRSKCGIRGSWQATLHFHNMPVPNDRVLGQPGKGLKVALSVLDFGRCTLSAGCVGGAKRAMELAVRHVKQRRQFGRSISEFHLVKEKIARMAETTFAMESLTYLAAGLVDRHDPDLMLETAIAKLFCSEGLWRIVDDTLQLWGGEGYMREHGIERMLRDARINRIVEGTTEVMTAFIALAGMKAVGEELEQVLRASKHPIGNFSRLARFAREQCRDVLIGPHIQDLHPRLTDEGHTLARLTTRLARDVSRVLRTHREKVLDMELVQQRISLSAVELFAMAAVISRLQSQLASRTLNGDLPADLERDLVIGKSFCHGAATNIRRRLGALFRNNDAETLLVANTVLSSAPA